MSTPLPDGGATQLPPHAIETNANKCTPVGSDREYKHDFIWLWVNGVWTNKVKCQNCGREEVRHD